MSSKWARNASKYLYDLTSELSPIMKDIKDDGSNMFSLAYQGGNSPFMIGMNEEEVSKDIDETSGQNVAMRTAMSKLVENLDSFIKESGRTEEAYDIADATINKYVESFKNGGDDAAEKIAALSSYDGKTMQTVVELAGDNGGYGTKTMFDYALSEEYGVGTLGMESAKQFSITGAVVMTTQSLTDKLEAIGNHVKQDLALRNTGVVGSLTGMAIGVGASMAEGAAITAILGATTLTGFGAPVGVAGEAAAATKAISNVGKVIKMTKKIFSLGNVNKVRALRAAKLIQATDIAVGTLGGNMYDNLASIEKTTFEQGLAEAATMAIGFQAVNRGVNVLSDLRTGSKLLNNKILEDIPLKVKVGQGELFANAGEVEAAVNSLLKGTLIDVKQTEAIKKAANQNLLEFVTRQQSMFQQLKRGAATTGLTTILEAGAVTGVSSVFENLYGDRFEKMFNINPSYLMDDKLTSQQKDELTYARLMGLGTIFMQKTLGKMGDNMIESRGRSKSQTQYLGNKAWLAERSPNYNDFLGTAQRFVMGDALAAYDAAYMQNPVFKDMGYNNLTEALLAGEDGKMAMAMAITADIGSRGWIPEMIFGFAKGTPLLSKHTAYFGSAETILKASMTQDFIKKAFGSRSAVDIDKSDIDKKASEIANKIAGVDLDDQLNVTDIEDIDINEVKKRYASLLKVNNQELKDAVGTKLRSLVNIEDEYYNPSQSNNAGSINKQPWSERRKMLADLTDPTKTNLQELTKLEHDDNWLGDTFRDLNVTKYDMGKVTKMLSTIKQVGDEVQQNPVLGKDGYFMLLKSVNKAMTDVEKTLPNQDINEYMNDTAVTREDKIKVMDEVTSKSFEAIGKHIDEYTETLVKLANKSEAERNDPVVKGSIIKVVTDIKNLLSAYSFNDHILIAQDKFLKTIKENKLVSTMINDAYKSGATGEHADYISFLSDEISEITLRNLNASYVDSQLRANPGNADKLEFVANLLLRNSGFGSTNFDKNNYLHKLLYLSAKVMHDNGVNASDIASKVIVKRDGKEYGFGERQSIIESTITPYTTIKNRDGFNEKEYVTSIIGDAVLSEALRIENVNKLIDGDELTINIGGLDHTVKLSEDGSHISIKLNDATDMSGADAYNLANKIFERREITKLSTAITEAKTQLGLYRDSVFEISDFGNKSSLTITGITEKINKALVGNAKGSLKTLFRIAQSVGNGDLDKTMSVLAASIESGTGGRIKLTDKNKVLTPESKKLLVGLMEDLNHTREVTSIKYNVFSKDVEFVKTEDFSQFRLNDSIMIDLAVPEWRTDITPDMVKDAYTQLQNDTNLVYTGTNYTNGQIPMFIRVPMSTSKEIGNWVKENIAFYRGTILSGSDGLEKKVLDAIDSEAQKFDSDAEITRDEAVKVMSNMFKQVRKVLNSELKEFESAAKSYKYKTNTEHDETIVKIFENIDTKLREKRVTREKQIATADAIIDRILKDPDVLLKENLEEFLSDQVSSLIDEYNDNNAKFISDTDAIIPSDNVEVISVAKSIGLAVKSIFADIESVDRSSNYLQSQLGKLQEHPMFKKSNKTTGSPVLEAVGKKMAKNANYLKSYLANTESLTDEAAAMEFVSGLATGFNTVYGDHKAKRPIAASNSVSLNNGSLTDIGKGILNAMIDECDTNGDFTMYILQDAHDREDGHLYFNQRLLKAYQASMSAASGEKLFMSQDGMILKANATEFIGDETALQFYDGSDGKIKKLNIGTRSNIISTNTLKEFNHYHAKAFGFDRAKEAELNAKENLDGLVIRITKNQLESVLNKGIDNAILTEQQKILLNVMLGLTTHADTKTAVHMGEFATQPDNLGDMFSRTLIRSMQDRQKKLVEDKLRQGYFEHGPKSLDKFKSLLHTTFNFNMSGMIDALHSGMTSDKNTFDFETAKDAQKGKFYRTLKKDSGVQDKAVLGSKAIGFMLEQYALHYSKEIAGISSYKKVSEIHEISSRLMEDAYTVPAEYKKDIDNALAILSGSDNNIIEFVPSTGATIIQKHGKGDNAVYTMVSARYPAQKSGQMGVTFIEGITKGTSGIYVEPKFWGRVKNADFDGDTGNFNSVNAEDILNALNAYNVNNGLSKSTDVVKAAIEHESTSFAIAENWKDVFSDVGSMNHTMEDLYKYNMFAASGLAINTLDGVAGWSYSTSKYGVDEFKVTRTDIARWADIKTGADVTTLDSGTNLTNRPLDNFNSHRDIVIDRKLVGTKVFGSMLPHEVLTSTKDGDKIIRMKTTSGQTMIAVAKSDKKNPYLLIEKVLISDDTNKSIAKINNLAKAGNNHKLAMLEFDTVYRSINDELKVHDLEGKAITSIDAVNNYIQSGPVDNVKAFGLDLMISLFGKDVDTAISNVREFVKTVVAANKMGSSVVNNKFFSNVAKMNDDVTTDQLGVNAAELQKSPNVIDGANAGYIEKVKAFMESNAGGKLSDMDFNILYSINRNKSPDGSVLASALHYYRENKSRLNLLLGSKDEDVANTAHQPVPARAIDAIHKLAFLDANSELSTDKMIEMFDDDLGRSILGKYMTPIKEVINEKEVSLNPFDLGYKITRSVNSLKVFDPNSLPLAEKQYNKTAKQSLSFSFSNVESIASTANSMTQSTNKSAVWISREDVVTFLNDMGISSDIHHNLLSDKEIDELKRNGYPSEFIESREKLFNFRSSDGKKPITNSEFFDKVKAKVNSAVINKSTSLDKASVILEAIVANMTHPSKAYFLVANSGATSSMLRTLREPLGPIQMSYDNYKINKSALVERYKIDRGSNVLNSKFNFNMSEAVRRENACV